MLAFFQCFEPCISDLFAFLGITMQFDSLVNTVVPALALHLFCPVGCTDAVPAACLHPQLSNILGRCGRHAAFGLVPRNTAGECGRSCYRTAYCLTAFRDSPLPCRLLRKFFCASVTFSLKGSVTIPSFAVGLLERENETQAYVTFQHHCVMNLL